MLKVGQKVKVSKFGEGTILEINGTRAKVDFNGEVKEMLTFVLNLKPKKEKRIKTQKEVKQVETFNTVVNGIVGDRTSRGSMFGFADIYTKIERMAFDDKTGESELAGKIIEDAKNGKVISNKQACVVAYFAKNNNLIK